MLSSSISLISCVSSGFLNTSMDFTTSDISPIARSIWSVVVTCFCSARVYAFEIFRSV